MLASHPPSAPLTGGGVHQKHPVWRNRFHEQCARQSARIDASAAVSLDARKGSNGLLVAPLPHLDRSYRRRAPRTRPLASRAPSSHDGQVVRSSAPGRFEDRSAPCSISRLLDGQSLGFVRPACIGQRRGMSAPGLGCVNTLCRKHGRARPRRGGHARSFFRVWRFFLSGSAPNADSSHPERFCNGRRMHVSVDYARIAARSGWTPMMFMTRVRL